MTVSYSSSLSEPPSTPDKRVPTEGAEEVDDVIPSSKRRRTNPAQLSTPVRRSSRLQTSPTRPSTSSSRSGEVFSHVQVATPTKHASLSPLGSPETTDEEGDVLISKPTQRTRKKPAEVYPESSGRLRAHKSLGVDDWLVSDDEVEYISSEDELVRTPRRRKSHHQRTREEQQELDADLEDLQDSAQDKSARRRRTRGGPVTTERDKARQHFDVLKRRRAGEKIPRIYDSDEDGDEGIDLSLIGRPSQEVDEDSAHSSVETELEAEETVNDDDFVEDDTTGRLNRPHPDIPLEFTHWASAQPRELFPYIIEWLVKNKLAPAFSRHDDIFKLAFDRIDDQVRGHAGSRLISSAWNAEFKWMILARPDMAIVALPGLDEDLIRSCDACNKANRPARYDFVLTGDAYYKDSLEPVDNSDDEDAGNDYDEAGHELASQDRHFYLGSHCAANAQMGHKLSHWKYHLNEYVLGYLEEEGVLSAHAIVTRDKLNNKKREKEAEAIVDDMETVGKIEELWRNFKTDLADAMLGMEDYQKRGGRSKGRIGVIRSSGIDGRVREWKDEKHKETIRIDSDTE